MQREFTHSNTTPFTTVVTIGLAISGHTSHNKLHLYNKEDSLVEWLSPLVADQDPVGAQDRVLPLSFGCYGSDLTGGIK